MPVVNLYTDVGIGYDADNHPSLPGQIRPGDITSEKLADNSVTTAKIANGTVIDIDIADSAITYAKIASGAVGRTSLATDVGSAVDASAFAVALTFDVAAYGAVRGTGVAGSVRTANTTAINAAAAAAKTADGILVIKGTYEIDGQVQFECHVDGTTGTLSINNTGAITAVLVGSRTPNTRLYNKNIDLPSVIQTGKTLGSGWSGTDVGVEISTTYSCQISTRLISQFSQNLWLSAYGAGNVYNILMLGHLENGKVGMTLKPGDTAGWVNQNLVIAGRISISSLEGTNIAGTRHILIPASTNPSNNNTFNNISVEGDGPGFHVECFGPYNMFFMCRWEATVSKIQFNSVNGTSNTVFYGYSAQSLVLTEVNGALYNHRYSRNNLRLSGGGTAGMIVGENTSSNANPIFIAMPSGSGPAADPATGYGVAIGVNESNYKRQADTFPRLQIDASNGRLNFGSGAAATDNRLSRFGTVGILSDKKLLATNGIGVGNSAAATTPGTVVKKMEVFDAAGASLGFVAIYNTIT